MVSMTGCGDATVSDGASTCRVEAAIRQRVRRGSVQVSLDLSGPAASTGRRLDHDQLAAYLSDAAAFCDRHGLEPPQSLEPLLGLPGIVVESAPDEAALDRAWPLIARAVAGAVDRLDAMRRTEAAALAVDMRSACREIVAIVAAIRGRVPGILADHRTRLVDRVSRLLEQNGTALTEADIAHEVALIADRSDIAEELVRLESHVAQFERLLETESPGRSLDFLAQELAREANTIASKSLDVDVAHAVVELKTRVERLREQVQNVE